MARRTPYAGRSRAPGPGRSQLAKAATASAAQLRSREESGAPNRAPRLDRTILI
jgi:hypothetical protein